MFDKKQQKHFQELLLNMRAEVAGAIAEDASQTVELDQARQGRLSRMDALQRQQLALETQRRQQRCMRAIDGVKSYRESGVWLLFSMRTAYRFAAFAI